MSTNESSRPKLVLQHAVTSVNRTKRRTRVTLRITILDEIALDLDQLQRVLEEGQRSFVLRVER